MNYHLILSFILSLTVFGKAFGQKKVLLRDVQALTLYKDQYTTGRRSSPVLQLQCLKNHVDCDAVDLKVVQCHNKGFDGNDYQWECKADMPKNFQFGKIIVSCEGYDYPDDPYVLAGSCGLDYEVIRTSGGYNAKQTYYKDDSYVKSKDSSSSFFVIICFVGIVLLVLWFSKSRQQPSTTTTSEPTQPPPYGFRDHQPPPPPYNDNPNQPPPPGFNPGSTSSSSSSPPHYGFKSASGQQHEQQQQQQQQQNQSPLGGFWTGAGLGGLAGYLFGSSRGNNHRGGAYDNYGSSFFGGGRTGYRDYNSGGGGFFGGGASGSGSSGWGGGSSGSTTETRTTSGFGGTKRR